VLLFSSFADRQAGIFEAQAAMAVRPAVVFLSRALAMVSLLTVACLLFTLPLYGLERHWSEGGRTLFEMLGEVVSFCMVVVALVLPASVLCRSGQQVNSVGGYVIGVAFAVGYGMLSVPLWVDLAGAFTAWTVCIVGLDVMGALNRAAVADPG
jgi:hypothetical protein